MRPLQTLPEIRASAKMALETTSEVLEIAITSVSMAQFAKKRRQGKNHTIRPLQPPPQIRASAKNGTENDIRRCLKSTITSVRIAQFGMKYHEAAERKSYDTSLTITTRNPCIGKKGTENDIRSCMKSTIKGVRSAQFVKTRHRGENHMIGSLQTLSEIRALAKKHSQLIERIELNKKSATFIQPRWLLGA